MKELYTLLKDWAYLLFVYLGIGTDIVKVLFVLMMFDSFLGILKALRLKQKFSFEILGWGIVGKLCLLLIPMTVALIAKALNLDFKIFLVSIFWILIVNEGISCITNIISIRIKQQIKNDDYVTKLLFIIKDIFKAIIGKILKAIEAQKGRP